MGSWAHFLSLQPEPPKRSREALHRLCTTRCSPNPLLRDRLSQLSATGGKICDRSCISSGCLAAPHEGILFAEVIECRLNGDWRNPVKQNGLNLITVGNVVRQSFFNRSPLITNLSICWQQRTDGERDADRKSQQWSVRINNFQSHERPRLSHGFTEARFENSSQVLLEPDSNTGRLLLLVQKTDYVALHVCSSGYARSDPFAQPNQKSGLNTVKSVRSYRVQP